jgi:hypothetical protein
MAVNIAQAVENIKKVVRRKTANKACGFWIPEIEPSLALGQMRFILFSSRATIILKP